MDSFQPQFSDESAELIGRWYSLIEDVVRCGVAVGQFYAQGPKVGSPLAFEIDDLRSHPTMPEGPLELVAQDTLGYLSAAGRHCLAVSRLLVAGEVFVSLMPLLRAQLEIYGRIAWFLEPTDSQGRRILPHRRVARHHMDVLASLCFRRYSASRRGDPRSSQKRIKRQRDAVRMKMLKLFPGAQLDWSNPGDETIWDCGGDRYVGLGDGAVYFDRVVLAHAPGHYDSLSDLTHPSIVTIRQMTGANEREGFVSHDWQVESANIARQVWNCGAMHAQATKLIASWLDAPVIAEADDLLDRLAEATATER